MPFEICDVTATVAGGTRVIFLLIVPQLFCIYLFGCHWLQVFSIPCTTILTSEVLCITGREREREKCEINIIVMYPVND